MAGKRTFKPHDWHTSDDDGWKTQREFSRRELGERHPYASLYGPRWLFWLTRGYGWLKISLALFALWALGHGGIPVVSEVIQWVGSWLWYLVKTAGLEVGGYVWHGLCVVGGWLMDVVVPAVVIGGLTAVYGLSAFLVWRFTDVWLWISLRLYTSSVIVLFFVIALTVGVTR